MKLLGFGVFGRVLKANALRTWTPSPKFNQALVGLRINRIDRNYEKLRRYPIEINWGGIFTYEFTMKINPSCRFYINIIYIYIIFIYIYTVPWIRHGYCSPV